MKNVRIDDNSQLHCWNCGATEFQERRTTRSVVWAIIIGLLTFGIWMVVFFLFTKKKLRCVACGEYNDVGNAQPYQEGPPTVPYPPGQQQTPTPESLPHPPHGT